METYMSFSYKQIPVNLLALVIAAASYVFAHPLPQERSLHIEFIAHIPIENCSIIEVQNDTAYIGTDSLYIIADIADYQHPNIIGSCTLP